MTATAGTWTVVGRVEDLTAGEGRTYVVDGRQVAVFLLADGTIRATDAVCPHRGGPLADGQIDGRVVVCPLHQYAFSLTDGTRTDGTRTDHTAPVAVHPARVRDGYFEVAPARVTLRLFETVSAQLDPE